MADCKRMKVQAMAVDRYGNVQYATNYNSEECTGEMGNCGCTHAEISLLEKMLEPYSIHVSHSPCLNCAEALVKAGVKVVTYFHDYRIKDGIEYLLENNVSVFYTGPLRHEKEVLH